MSKETGMTSSEAGKQRLIANQKAHPQRGPKNLKGEELKAHNQRMGKFMGACKKNRGFSTQIITDSKMLISKIDEYIATVEGIGLFPTMTGLALYCDIDINTLYALEKLSDERSQVIKKYRTYISEFFNQSGLTSSTNPIFSIYYGKSVLGQSDQAPIDINVNMGSQSQAILPEDAENIINLTPEEWKNK